MDVQVTEAQVSKYLEGGAQQCPECGETDISGGQANFDGLASWRDVECQACGGVWREVFRLVSIEEPK